MPADRGSTHNDDMHRCIENCTQCHDICAETIQYCLQEAGKHASADHIRLLLDCVDICRTSANYMLRGSDLHMETCAVCADVCERCAKSCEAMGDDATMRRCAETCRRCAESCRRMAGKTRIAHAA
jgi:hypothetical protein